jgi:hypothetical protein
LFLTMTASSPEPPLPPEQSPKDPLGFDDFVGIFIAMTSVGAVLVWAIRQSPSEFQVSLSSAPVLQRPLSVRPTSTVSPTPSAIGGVELLPSVPTPLSTQTPSAPLVLESVPTTSWRPSSLWDVPANFWARAFIAELTRRSIINRFPDGTFRPHQPITRADFSMMIQKASLRPARLQPLDFKDLPSQYWAASAVSDAVQSGFMSGYPDGHFRPDQPLSKVQAISALASGLNLPSPTNVPETLAIYQDSNQVPRYATQTVAAATTAGLVVNYPTRQRLEPQQVVTRADAAALIYQALVRSGQANAIQSDYIVRP